jgi:hypothetical protein
MSSCNGAHLPIVMLLLQRGASVLKKDEVGWRPYQYAAYYGHPDVLRLLLSCAPTGWAREGANVGLAALRISFSPSANISEERKREVRGLLSEVQRQLEVRIESVLPGIPPVICDMTAVMTAEMLQPQLSRPAATQYGSTIVQAPAIPELPGTLEQGLSPSRSVTPEQMRRDMRHHGDTLSQAVREQTSPVGQIAMPRAQ